MIPMVLIAVGVVYFSAGALVALAFVAFGMRRVEAKTRGAHPLFYVLILPGLIGLWPLVVARWRGLIQARRGGEP